MEIGEAANDTWDAAALATTTESVKLIKNTKGYNWEIKQLSLDLDALEKLNNTMMEKFGGLV